ncbi:MAG: bifunctional phosphoribosylaminoimidazolecarboxamide formyltransferase/IMP cyclohydrolase [Candidatus Pelagibacter sp. TMED196]|nr:MAG: bifunctional phosphoribosylaminoimidazolecarboxamide formyltransferase/IMP cyclohydrolase [Candidatus Pelagibacter sp. TMED196]
MGTYKNFMKKIKNAIISVSDKKKLNELLKILEKNKVKLLSSGGTYREIKKLGFKCHELSNYTNFNEILDGRVKTLHPKIYAGILNKRNKKQHKNEMKLNKFENIDLVVVNFYPFEKTLKSTTNHKKIIENIDIGGPAMVRAAAKNYEDVTVITSDKQYAELIYQLKNNSGSTSLNFRKKMSEEAFLETGFYDSLIAKYFDNISFNKFPKKKLITANLVENLRYGENPHQEGALYSYDNSLNLNQISGKKLSYNNYNDIFSALNISKTLPKNIGTVIVKHANPCGVSISKNNLESFKLALNCDPLSAFGGIVSCNFIIDKKLAAELNKIFLEVIIGNGFSKDAIKILCKKKNLRLIDASKINLKEIQNISSNLNSILIQTSDNKVFKNNDFKVVSKKKPSINIFKNLIFAFNVCRFVKSNAIVLVKNRATIGIGSGQPSRLDSCKIAIDKMKKFQKNTKDEPILAASDAFFPFVDGIESLVQAGVTAIIQPSGSIRDKEIIKFANRTGTILLFSKTRHFKH